jgi:erythromycin esterase
MIGPLSAHDADVFAVPVAADGTFEAVLPRGDTYYATELGGDASAANTFARSGDRVEAVVTLVDRSPPPPEIVDYIRAHAIPLATVEAGHGFDDMAAIGKLVGDAHLVALGEATHGSREFFQMKHRMLEYLVGKKGFTMFAIEANEPECRAIDDYVLHGTGDARTALRGIYFWTWNTEEVLAMIEWMRAWNADAAHKAKVSFVGFDMQTAKVAHASVAAFLGKVTPADADALLAPIAALPGSGGAQTTADDRAKLAAGLAALGAAFDAHAKAWTAASSATAFADARHDVTILEEFLRLIAADEDGSFAVRDQAMADNLGWLRAQHPGARIVVWAHNGHVANSLANLSNMGSHLRAKWKKDYLNLGFLFGDGAFQAMDASGGGLTEHALPPAPEHYASAAFARTGKPLLVLDLRALPASGPVHDWFAVPHPVRETGAVFTTEKAMTVTQVLPALYDAVIYIATTTRARPLTD